MGNERNKKKKKSGWRKYNGRHMQSVKKSRQSDDKEEETLGLQFDDLCNKENTPPVFQTSSPVKIKLNICNEQDVKTFHNMEPVQILSPDCINFNSSQNLNETGLKQFDTTAPMDMSRGEKSRFNESKPDDNVKLLQDSSDTYEIEYCDLESQRLFPVEGNRIVNIEYFYSQLQKISDHNKVYGCTLSNIHISSERRKGLISQFKLTCNMCNMSFLLDSEPKTILDLNKSAITGVISSGIGHTQFNEICAAINCPPFTAKHYNKVQSFIYDDWRKTALSVMEAAGTQEREVAIAEGRVNQDGIACIDVIADGVWCKRSYNTNFSALSGAAAIIGKRFGKVLFIGVKNKYCCICTRAENKNITPGPHVCYKNYSGSSTGMESDILLEGFKQSIVMHKLIYNRIVADGDSSTYKKILEGRPYPNNSVEKIECKNHIFRNMCKKLKSITTDTKYPVSLRKKITTQRIMAIRKVICLSISAHISNNTDFDTKVNDLYKDISNSYNHAFGNHEHCLSYYCSSQRNSEDLTLTLKTCAIWHRIRYIVNTVAAKARSLMHNSDTNKVESFNSIIAKFIGGKRINFSMRQGYESRCNAAVVSFNTKHPLSTLHTAISRKSPKKFLKRFEEQRLKRRYVSAKYKNKSRNCISKNTHSAGDKDYGENCQKPDLSKSEYVRCKDEFLKQLALTETERIQIERSTILQRDSSEWLELRRKLLTASNFAKVVNRRHTTSVKNLVKTLLYQKDLTKVSSVKHGIENEAVALEQLSVQLKINIEPCGLFIDKKIPFLGATPDGLVGEDTIVEIKCPITAFRTSIEDAIEKKKVNFWRKTKEGLQINKKHSWFIQVQGQLHIADKRQCIFAVWSGLDKELKVEIIERDDQFWKQTMENKLKDFYTLWMLPELCDPRQVRNMPIRDLNESY